jgi:nucleoside-diphosphate-sugar epimerase/uncharacterized membrane protein
MKMTDKPVVLITGAAGDIGSSLAEALADDFLVVGFERSVKSASIPLIEVDLGVESSIRAGIEALRERYGNRLASVIHLAAYFDFTGEENPLYQTVNVAGTRSLLDALQSMEVEQFLYSGTMLVHAPCAPGEVIDESQPIEPRWAYPRSKAAAEETIRQHHGHIPYVLLHLAGVYDEARCVPTLAHQMARIYERDFESYLYSGDTRAGQSMLHKEDMVDAFRRAVVRRRDLPADTVLLIGEPRALAYDELQDELGRLIHGESAWTTMSVPKPLARAGAAVQGVLEPIVPDAFDQGQKPFIRPFMIEMADDHYALGIAKAQDLLGWEPRHHIRAMLPKMVAALKSDPLAWYRRNGLNAPPWMMRPEATNAESVRSQHEEAFRAAHRQALWAPFFNISLGLWLLATPWIIDLRSTAMIWSDMVSGLLVVLFASLSLSWRLSWSRWACAGVGIWVMTAPLLFWAPTSDAYLNDTLVGFTIVALAVLMPPEVGVSPLAATSGPTKPPGWTMNPSSWTQRLPVIALALVGVHVSRYLAAYQLGHIDSVWDPFFAGSGGGENGTAEIITSEMSRAWPVPDAGLGALTYLLEIATGVIGSRRRWRTMPWLVLLFGLMIVPLGAVSLFFIIIQPIWIGTWCTLCLVAAAAMLVQIPYSLDELVASSQFLLRRKRAGYSLLRVFLFGDTDEGKARDDPDEFDRSPRQVVRDVLSGGVNLPWTLAASVLLGAWLMFTRVTFGTEGSMANADHLIGSLVITASVIACAEVARTARYLNAVLGAALLVTPFVFDAEHAQMLASVFVGVALILLSLPRGAVRERYGSWDRFIR